MIYLMRHGQDDEYYIGGWSDVKLIPLGVEQVNDSTLWIKENLNIRKIVASDVTRAIQTAEIVSFGLGVSFSLDSNLREQNKGLLNGMVEDVAKVKYQDLLKEVGVDTTYPEGESLRDLYQRMKVYVNKIMLMEDDTLLITHRGVINMIYYILQDIPLDMNKGQFGVETASVHELDVYNKLIRRVK